MTTRNFEPDRSSFIYRLRQEQDALLRGDSEKAARES
jgi:predicted homoserine dehydrogenase-like protein